VATAREVESLRVPRRYWDTGMGVVAVPASDDEIRATDLAPSPDAGAWPRVLPGRDLLASALSRLLGLEHVEMSLQPGRDGLKASLISDDGHAQPFPIAPKDALGLLAAVFQNAPRGVVRLAGARPAALLITVRPAARRREYRLRLSGVIAAPPPTALHEIGLCAAALELLLEWLERPAALLIVAGGPASGRSTTLEMLVATLLARGRRGGRIGAAPPMARAPIPWLADTLSDWPFPESLHDAAPDFVAIDCLDGPADRVLAARFAAGGALVIAGAPAADPEALKRSIERDIEAGAAPPVPVTVLGQSLIRTVCRACVAWNTLPPAQARRLAFHVHDLEEIERRGGLAFAFGRGCAECAGTGAAGLTGVFGYAGPERAAAALPTRREEAWRKVVEGTACHQDAMGMPGAGLMMRSLRVVAAHAGRSPAAEPAAAAAAGVRHDARPSNGDRPRAAKGPSAASLRALTVDDALTLARALKAARQKGPVDPEAIPALAQAVAGRCRQAERLHEALAPSDGYHLARHAVNTALIAARITTCLDPPGDPVRAALLSLVHDAGLVDADVQPDSELPAVPSEESLDPGDARFKPHRMLAALGLGEEGLGDLAAQVHLLLRHEPPPPAERHRLDARAQTVALAALMELRYHAPDDRRPADLNDVTSVIMAEHGQRFGPMMFRALLRALPVFPIGALVELSSGDLARVVSLNDTNHFRPCVEIAGSSGEPAGEGRVVDLARAPFLHIRQRVPAAAAAAGAGA